MMTYNEFDVRVLEDIKILLSEDETTRDYLEIQDIYLHDIPEGNKNNNLIVRLNILTIDEDVFYGNDSHGDEFVIQVDVWDVKRPPISLCNRIRKALKGVGFTQLEGTFDNLLEEGKHRDSRRYISVLQKEGSI